MSIDSVSNGRDIDGTADSADRAEQVAGTPSGAAESRPAETLSREEYSDQVRARGSPIGQRETSPPGAADSGQPGTQADAPQGRPADETERTGQPAERITPSPTRPEESRERQTAPGRTRTSPDTRWEDAWNLPDARQIRVHLDGDHDWMHSGAADTTAGPPTGEELLSLEDEEASRSEKLRSKFYEKEPASRKTAQAGPGALSPSSLPNRRPTSCRPQARSA